jgi:sugar O-acyltransferase (sialic acid O-acetyltransferase NeuD family)
MKIGIYGSGGLGKEVYELAGRINAKHKRWDEIVFVDDVRDEGVFFGTRSVKFERWLEEKGEWECVIGIGEPSSREKLCGKILQNEIKLATLIDPSALISPRAEISCGSIVCEFASIHADVSIGRNCLIQPYCVVGHDTRIGDHSVFSTHCAPGGSCIFGERVFAGMHSSIKEKVQIGDDVIIAMGASVFQNLPDGVTVVGNPARITRGRDDHKVF